MYAHLLLSTDYLILRTLAGTACKDTLYIPSRFPRGITFPVLYAPQ